MTRVGLVFLACAAALTLGTARWLTRDRLRRLAGTIVAVGALLALAGIIQRATSPALIYGGAWKPFQGTDPFGPFVNKNHFAGWMLMGLPVALGLAAGLTVRSHGRLARDWRSRLVILAEAETSGAIIVLFCAFLMVMSLLFTLSRSGITAGVVSTAVAVAVTASVFRGWRRLAVVAVVAGIIVGAVAWVGVDLVTARFSALDSVSYGSRAQIWHDTWRMVEDVPLVGVGIRAYTVASLAYQTALPDMHVGAAHNDWLQLIAEGGLLVGVPALCLLAMLVIQGARRFGEHRAAQDFGTLYWIRVGAATGILAVSLQSLVEFSLQMPGNTVMFAVLWAMVVAPLRMLRPA